MPRKAFLASWPRLLLCLALAAGANATLQYCHPFAVKAQATVDYNRVSGRWYLRSREDIGGVEVLTNTQVNITAYPWTASFDSARDLPLWFTPPHGGCLLNMEYLGRDAKGNCVGKIFRWGVGVDTTPGLLKHKLLSMASYSLLYVVWTDYDNSLVLAHCRSEVDYKTYRLYCTHFNALLLSRTSSGSPTYDLAAVQARLLAGCTGNVTFPLFSFSSPECSYSSVSFKEPSLYEINSI